MSSLSGVPASGTPSYLQVLRLPRAARLFGFALWGRLSYGTVFLSLTLALTRATGSYTTTGACLATFGLANAFFVPMRAAMIDRYGVRKTLAPMAVVYASLLASISIAITLPRPIALLLVVLCAAAGICAPPLGPTMRTLWAELATDPAMRRRAFALDTVCEEVLFLLGPLLAGALSAWAAPVAGVLASAGLVLTGTLAMVSALPPRSLQSCAPDTHKPSPRPSIRRAGMTRRIDTLGGALPAALVTGISLSAFSLLIVAFAQDDHQLSAVAWVEAGMSAGSACGGLAFGALNRRASNRLQLSALLAVIGASTVAAGFAGNLAMLIALACAQGLFVSPTITMTYVVADEAARADRRTKAGGLVNGAYNLGSSTGSAAAGLLLGGFDLRWCFLLAGVPTLATALSMGARVHECVQGGDVGDVTGSGSGGRSL